MLAIAEAAALVERCAPGVAAPTLLAIIEVESGFRPLAIGTSRPSPPVARRDAAIVTAADLIAAGVSVDLGLAQINSRNLRRLGLTISDAFDPCRNLAAAAVLLREGFTRASAKGLEPQTALRAALSTYNTGDPRRGLANGYVAKVVTAAVRYGAYAPDTDKDLPEPAPLAWDVFANRPAPRFVLTVTPGANP